MRKLNQIKIKNNQNKSKNQNWKGLYAFLECLIYKKSYAILKIEKGFNSFQINILGFMCCAVSCFVAL